MLFTLWLEDIDTFWKWPMKAFAAVWIFATVILIWGEAFNKARGWHPRNYLEDYDPRYSGTYTGSCKTTYSYTPSSSYNKYGSKSSGRRTSSWGSGSSNPLHSEDFTRVTGSDFFNPNR